MPRGMQRNLSQGVKQVVRRGVLKALRADRSLGCARRLQRHLEESHSFAGDAYAGVPWQECGGLHLSNEAVRHMCWLRYRLRMPASRLPPRKCICGWKGHSTHGTERGTLDCAPDTELEHEWVQHALVCPKRGELWTKTHDEVVRVWMALLKNAGFTRVKLEPRDWDVGDASRPKGDVRRPDITGIDPRTGQKVVLDVTICWREEDRCGGQANEQRPGAGAAAKEKEKHRCYKGAEAAVWKEKQEKRRKDGTMGTIADDWPTRDRFVPLGFEANGAWGPEAREFLKEVAECARAKRSVELYGWSAMTYVKHWRQRIGVVVGRGRFQAIADAVSDHQNRKPMPNQQGADGKRSESQEWDPYGSG